MKDPTIWDLFVNFFNIFISIGEGTRLTGQEIADPAFTGSNIILSGEPSPLVTTILSEVKTGWSMETILDFWGPLLQIPFLIFFIFGTGIIYCTIRVYQIRKIEEEEFRAYQEQAGDAHHAPSGTQLRWQRVLEQASSDDAQQWRSAILEADQMLNELLDTLGYKGETMGDKMRKADVNGFKTIDFAWEAHQVRNLVAQDPQFEIDAREAKRVIKMYERVFEEFHFIGDGGHEHSH